MDFLHFKNRFQREKLLPLYLVYGEEGFFVKEAVSLIKSRILEGDVTGLVETDGEMTSLSTVLEEVRTPSLFSGRATADGGSRKLVIVYNADGLFKESSGVWERYMASPPTDCVLVLVCKDVDTKGGAYEKIRKKGGGVNCRRLKGNELTPWILERVRHYGKQISLDASRILQENVGDNLLLLDGHLEKLALYLGSRTRIEASDVEALVGYDRQQKVFDFTGAVAKRDTALALKVLHQLMALMKSGEEPQGIIPPLAWQLRRLLQAKRILTSGKGRETVARELNVRYPRFLEELVNQTQLFSEVELERDYQFLLETDISSKTGGMDARLLLETLVFKLCM
ncbi:MAG: DNA polymerase III subunit delta [Candidatus Brocadiaceae bacterium]|nr:DNA polymerase III subunit delta [Candidatus Brocadiaceae bacterium]